jgi:parvulin-like peptidyl-prolyl isomerase
MEIGQISKPIKSSFGYHIVKLEDLLYSDTGVATKARASHILIRGFDFNEWIEKQKQELAIYRLVI